MPMLLYIAVTSTITMLFTVINFLDNHIMFEDDEDDDKGGHI